mmetsp:Transcript_19633/g.50728  ORF Transcript_19633/g.50728 Transcript_19633/m.50728 type:complete len:213 (-) Transcript_19633:286-924(-)
MDFPFHCAVQAGPLTMGVSLRAPHSAQLPSYTATRSLPSCAAASASTHAVIPLPQLDTKGSPLRTPARSNTAWSFSAGASCVPPSAPGTGSSSSENGTFLDPGMCPLTQSGRGSGAVPSKRPEARASTTCEAQPAATSALTSSIVRTSEVSIPFERHAGWASRRGGGAAPRATSNPAARHAGRPPSSTDTAAWPCTRNVHHARGELKIPEPS